MDELAAATAVLAMDVDPEDGDIAMLESTQGSLFGTDAQKPMCEVPAEDKENNNDSPVDRQPEAEDPKVMMTRTSLLTPPYLEPEPIALLPPCPQATVAALLERAEAMFLEGSSKPRAVAKVGSAARLVNALVVYAKEAIEELQYVRLC